MSGLERLLDFVRLTNNFRKIERDILLLEESRPERSIEHSYQLTIVAWYLATVEGVGLDLSRIIKYALVHDLVEVYAGDTPLYSANSEYTQNKKDREEKSAARIQREFPEFVELHQLIENYEARSDRESKFVYAVDKLLPLLSIYLDRGHAWKTHGITPDAILGKNALRVSVDPTVNEYFNELMDILQDTPAYFEKQPINLYENLQKCCNE